MKTKKIPLRKCLVSNQQYPKHELTRIVLNKEAGLVVDPSGKINGRGAYLKLSQANIDMAEKRRVFEREFKIDDASALYQQLRGLAHE